MTSAAAHNSELNNMASHPRAQQYLTMERNASDMGNHRLRTSPLELTHMRASRCGEHAQSMVLGWSGGS
jgi:hypothetical protein